MFKPLYIAHILSLAAASLSTFAKLSFLSLMQVYFTHLHAFKIEAAFNTFEGFSHIPPGEISSIVWLCTVLSNGLALGLFYGSNRQQHTLYCGLKGKVMAAAELQQALQRERRANHDAMHAKEQMLGAQQEKIRANEENMQLRDRYIGALSHDFGTPIAAMQMALNALAEELLFSGGTAYSSELILSLRASLDLIKMIRLQAVTYSSLANGRDLEPELAPLSLAALLDKMKLVQRFTPRTSEMQMSYALLPGCPEMVVSNLSWLMMMMTNFVSNALKHAQATCVAVDVSYDDKRKQLCISVSDNGNGVPLSFRDSLFSSFATTSKSGCGLGLYNVSQMAKALGGDVEFRERDPPPGSVFCFRVPCEPVARPLASTLPPSQKSSPQRFQKDSPRTKRRSRSFDLVYEPGVTGSRSPDLRSAHAHAPDAAELHALLRRGPILLVEDCSLISWLTESMFRKWGATAMRTAKNGKEAVELLCAPSEPFKPALVIMDVQMPVLDGIEATRQIRQSERERQVPRRDRLRIVGFSANAEDDGCRECALDAGMDELLCKPVKWTALLACLRDCEAAAQS